MNKTYFTNYCDRGQPYSKCWKDHSGFDDCLYTLNTLNLKEQIHTVLVLGSADSSILNAFEEHSFVADGIELCPDIVPEGETRVTVGNFLDKVPDLVKQGMVFDLIFSNSLVYLAWDQVIPFLGLCSYFAPYFHYSSSTTEHFAVDVQRTILQPQETWDKKFEIAGWKRTPHPYLYRSRMFV